MYKTDYTNNDFILVADECSTRIKEMLQERYNELEGMRDAINDRYPFEELFIAQTKIDYEKKLIQNLIEHLKCCTSELKKTISDND